MRPAHPNPLGSSVACRRRSRLSKRAPALWARTYCAPALLGMDRATLVRFLQKLRRLGVIRELNRDRLVIGDMKKLRQLAVQ